jgi:hypothetical protein
VSTAVGKEGEGGGEGREGERGKGRGGGEGGRRERKDEGTRGGRGGMGGREGGRKGRRERMGGHYAQHAFTLLIRSLNCPKRPAHGTMLALLLLEPQRPKPPKFSSQPDGSNLPLPNL